MPPLVNTNQGKVTHMRLRTIWTIPAMALPERLHRTSEWFWLKAARHIPERLAYWSFVVHGTRYIAGNEVVHDVKYMDLFGRMEHR